ncbi:MULTISPECIES: hypothetical protein [Pseudonocardia]|uniref:Uncharacterized protein n=2 Tax=Pseudonocardia TaxID=1847 RepID=A0A1Y2MLE1_PSEAH|nr:MULTISPECIES: hypothetical protein [Pseudonocardia]OSY36093.1 hypothetical protein BG845_05608 [Pseudonocardia autotrophica]TDN77574.1 hypothetical protein C8E95_6823 [Pseudonocardia autotrophica]BBG01603.1 hypothetical protein Pdca_28120 [Pseudonocardia autotrophica]GEC25348.1 hypothetical protein PSA01_23770 [Pseudonocardia saturnea]
MPSPTRCYGCTQPATRIVEWRTPDPHSRTGEFYGPYYLATCDDCVGDAHAHANDEGATHIDEYRASNADLSRLTDDRRAA